MNKIYTVILVFIFCITALLAGCGKTAEKEKDYEAMLIGEWRMSGMNVDGQYIKAIELELLGLRIPTLTLSENKSYTLQMADNESTGTWSANSATEITLTVDGMERNFAMSENGNILFEYEETSIVFEKV